MKLSFALLLTITVLPSARAAWACGGGVVTTPAGNVGATAQRIILSAHDGVTDVITQVGVPSTTADYGVLIPVPGEPTLDSAPVASEDLDRLFSATEPRIQVHETTDDHLIGCGCGSSKAGGGAGDATVGTPVTIGPVTAVTITADTGAAINAWLADNGFTVTGSEQSIVDAYSGPGRYFIAIRRSDTALTSAPSSVGVHFTLAGDQRGLPLRFARLGVDNRLAFTVLVAAEDVVAPSAPFQALTLDDLATSQLRTSYYAAVSSAVDLHAGLAFVLEGAWQGADLQDGARWPSLAPFIRSGMQVTRLSSAIRENDLIGIEDVTFDQPYTGAVPHTRVAQGAAPREARPRFALGGAGLLAFAAIARRRPRRAP